MLVSGTGRSKMYMRELLLGIPRHCTPSMTRLALQTNHLREHSKTDKSWQSCQSVLYTNHWQALDMNSAYDTTELNVTRKLCNEVSGALDGEGWRIQGKRF